MKTFICSTCKCPNFFIYGSNVICATCRKLIIAIDDITFNELLEIKSIEVKQ